MTEVIRTLLNIVKLLVAILPFVLLCLESRKVNLPKPDRSKQIFMPVVAVIYAIIAM